MSSRVTSIPPMPLDIVRRYLPPATCWASPTRHVSRNSNVNGFIFLKTVKRTIVPLGRSSPWAIAIPIASCSTGTTFYDSSPRSNSRRRQPPISFGGSTRTRNSTGSIRALKAFGQILKSHFILRVIDELALRMAIERVLNGIEHVHRFTRAVSVGNPREFLQAEKQEQEMAEAASGLLRTASFAGTIST